MNKTANNQNELLKLLGVGFGIAVTVGGTIGTGILRTPGPIAEQLGNGWLIMGVWVVVSLYAFFGALCAIELAVSVPKAGSWYVYAQRAFGDYVGFLTGITTWLGTIASLGFGSYTISEYIILLLPDLSPFLIHLAIGVLAILSLFHMIGTAIGGRSQEILAVIKALGLAAFVIVCFIYGGNNEPVSTENVQKLATGGLIFGIISALQGVFYTFDGWHTAGYFSEENTDAAKNLPKAMISGVLVIIAIYLLVNAAILYILPLGELANSKLAAADAIQKIFGEQSGRWVTLFLLISILGIMNTQVMMTPRTLFSMSRDGLFFKKAVAVNKGGSPAYALMITCVLSIGLILIGKETSGRLLDISTFYFVSAYALGFASLLRLRQIEPDLERSYKAPFYPYLPWTLLIASVAFLVGSVVNDPTNSLYAILFLFLSYPLYLLLKKTQANT